jgi:integrase
MRLTDESDYPDPSPIGSPCSPDSDTLRALRALADDLARSSRAPNTNRAYATAWSAFSDWSRVNRLPPLPASPEAVAIYLAHLVAAGKRTSTIQSALTAVSQRHVDAGHPSPRNDPHVRRVIAGVRRRRGSDQRAKTAITGEQVDAMIVSLGTDLRGLRDRAILALGFATGMRRSELVALDLSDLQRAETALWITIRKSKWQSRPRRLRVIQTGRPSCPITALLSWIETAGLQSSGPVFKKVSGRGTLGVSGIQDAHVARLVKRAALQVGLDPKSFSGHSLRSGFATASARAGVSAGQIQAALGHSSPGMSVRYIQDSGDEGPFHATDTR